MSMNSPHESVKDIITSVWKNNRPLAIAVLIVAVIAGYVLYKRSQASIIAPGADVTPSATGLPGNTYNNTYTTITKTVTGLPGPSGPSGPPGPPGPIQAPPPPVSAFGNVATIRSKQTSGIDKAWDSSHSGVPVRAQPSGSAGIIRILGFGSTVQLLHSSLTAAPNQKGGSSKWYPVAGGYLSAWDIASIK